MFVALLVGLLVAGLVHARQRPAAARGRTAELLLVYVLVGYCGFVQIAIGLSMFATDHVVQHLARVDDAGPLLPWIASLYTGAGVLAALALRWRGDYLVGPALLWAIFFAGATYAHLHTEAVHDRLGLHGALWIVASHGLVSVVLLALLWSARRSAQDRLAPV